MPIEKWELSRIGIDVTNERTSHGLVHLRDHGKTLDLKAAEFFFQNSAAFYQEAAELRSRIAALLINREFSFYKINSLNSLYVELGDLGVSSIPSFSPDISPSRQTNYCLGKWLST